MQKRLTDAKRAALESRYKRLKQVRAYLEPGKVSNIVDSVSPEEASIKNVVEKLMSLMDAEDGLGKYKVASKAVAKKKLTSLVRKAFAEDAHEADESPMEEAKDLQNPILHPVEDLEHEVQSMDDEHLTHEVEQLEDDLKQQMAGHDDETPVEEEKPELSPEHKMALLMTLPKQKRFAKAANLRALANALEMAEHEVSNDNFINNTEKSDEALANDYQGEEEGSMKDTGKTTAALKATLRQLIAASEEVSNEDEEAQDEEPKRDEEMEREAVLKLALRHLLASVEDMENAEDESEDEAEDEAEAKAEEEAKDEEEAETEEPTMEEKRAILRARLASLRKSASVDGKDMKTPKEVPSPSGTTEDNLKGDAKIQYSTATGESGLDVILDKREKLPTDKQVAGNDEPNEVYFSSAPTSDHITTETDSSKDVNNKRVLKDEGTAVQKAEPASPNDNMEMGAGSHQKEKDWEKAKAESDVTPTGDRLVGLAEIVKSRTDRAMKLASKMAARGLIKTEAQLHEQVVKFATMDDEVFEKVAEFFESTGIKKKAEFPEDFKKEEKAEDSDDEDDDSDMEEEDEEPVKHEARSIRRKASPSEDNFGDSVRRASRGVTQALNLGGEVRTASGSPVANKLKALEWSDAKVEASKLGKLDKFFDGSNSDLV
jgi:hypothetical protein